MVISQESAQSAVRGEEKPHGALLAPYFLARVTGLSFSLMEQLQFSRTVAIVEELLSLENWFESQTEHLLEDLKAHFKRIEEREIQHKGLDLQRAIISQNGQKARKLSQIVASFLPEMLVQRCEEWTQYSLRRAELLVLGEPTLQAELIENRKKLRKWFCKEEFQQGLILSSDTLSKELHHYLDSPPERSNNRLRKAEEGLLSYFIRMATKTSPFSTFCSTSLGIWGEQDGQPDGIRVQTWEQQRHVRFHAGLLATIAYHLATCPEVRPYLRPALNTTLKWITQDVVTQSQGTDQVENVEKIEVFIQDKIRERKYTYQERLVRMRVNPLARELITAIEQANGTLTYQELLAQLVERLLSRGETQKDEQSKQKYSEALQQKAQQTLEYLTKHSVVALDLHIPAHEEDKLKFLIQRLIDIPGSWVADIRHALEQVHQLMSVYAHAPARECARLLPLIRDIVLHLCQEICARQESPWDVAKTIETIYPALILEDTTMPFAALTLKRKNWEPVLQDLQVLQEIAPVFDLGVITKMNMDLWAKEAFAEKSSHTEDLIGCHIRFWKEFMGNDELQQQWMHSHPQFIQLRTYQRSLLALLRQSIQQAQQERAQVARLDPQELHGFAQQFPDFLRPREALAYFGQCFFDQKQPSMVLNTAWTGPGTAFSRFSYLFQQVPMRGHDPQLPEDAARFVDVFREYITQLGHHHHVAYASIDETGDIDVNLHAPLTPYEILSPMSASQRAKEEQITLRDLYVRFHEEKQEYQIYSQRLNKQISPVHMGFSLLQMLPPLYQAMVTTTTHYPLLDLIALLESQISVEEKQQPRHYPRLALGSIILNRESWKVPAAMVPQREAGETSFDYFLKINRWRVASELPLASFRRIVADANKNPLPGFLTMEKQSSEQRAESSDSETPSKKVASQRSSRRLSNTLSKPFYMHFHNYFLVSLFGAITKNIPADATLSFEEVLPTPEQHLLKQGNESYASEFIFEMSMKIEKE